MSKPTDLIPILLKLPPDLVERIDQRGRELAESTGLVASRTAVVRRAVNEAFPAPTKPAKGKQ